MRRALVGLFVLVVALALALPAAAANPAPKQLESQIRVLQKQVKKLQTQVVEADGLAIVALVYGACNSAATADALQGLSPLFGTTPVNDYSPASNSGTACGDLGRFTSHTIARQPKTATVSVFQAMLSIFAP
ncbi:MAG TPA: hypothetical protein VF002_10795 [Gaiellaceae bacterium]